MKKQRIGFAFAALWILFISPFANCQTGSYQVYFVAVGSRWYAPSPSKDVHSFGEIDGANASAAIVANGLASGGAVYGVKLTSEDGSYVTTKDIGKTIQTVAAKIAADKPSKPLLVFYIASHGMSEGIAWSHFSIPGDFGYRGDPNQLDIDKLSANTLYAGSLVDDLEKLKAPFLVLLDSCYDGKEKHFEPTVLSAEATRNLNDVGAALRVMNEFRDTYPVLFSTTPGQSVPTATNPLAPDSQVNIGPIARRFALSTQQRLAGGHTLSLATLIGDLTSPQLDNVAAPAVTHSKIPAGAEMKMLQTTQNVHAVDTMIGTGTHMNVCCNTKASSVANSAHTSSRFAGMLSLSGDTGEFVSGGRSWTLKSPALEVQLSQDGPGQVEISFGHGEKEFDASFSTENGRRFEVRSYPAAERWGFASNGHPGIEVSGDGRGCNGIVGSFDVTAVEYKPNGSIAKFAATFVQRCDDSQRMARGSVSISTQ
jgi:hypothetical protein